MNEKAKINLLSKKDLKVSYFCGSGPGGQAKNKTASGVQFVHEESGAIGRSSDSRSQHDNKKAAFQRLLEDPRMKFWLARKLHEIKLGETLEENIEKDTQPHNLKFEIKNSEGKWEEVTEDYFNSSEAKQIS